MFEQDIDISTYSTRIGLILLLPRLRWRKEKLASFLNLQYSLLQEDLHIQPQCWEAVRPAEADMQVEVRNPVAPPPGLQRPISKLAAGSVSEGRLESSDWVSLTPIFGTVELSCFSKKM